MANSLSATSGSLTASLFFAITNSPRTLLASRFVPVSLKALTKATGPPTCQPSSNISLRVSASNSSREGGSGGKPDMPTALANFSSNL